MLKIKERIGGEKLYEALQILIEATQEMQNNFKDEFALYSAKSYAKEFCTVHLRAARRSGHDYCIAKMLKESPGLRPLILCPSQNTIENMKNEINKHEVKNKIIFHHPNANWSNLEGAEIDCMICNCSSLFPSNKIDKIYDLGSLYIPSNPSFLFFMIG